MKVAVFGRSASEDNVKALRLLCEFVQDSQIEVIVYRKFWNLINKQEHAIVCNYSLFDDFSNIKNEIDFVFSIGGDGTLLNTADLVLNSSIPVIGINTGRLGFLANFQLDEIQQLIKNLKQNEFEEDHRRLLEITCNQDLFGEKQFALNEFTIQKKDPSAVIKVHAYINDEFLSSYWSDGIIVSTPTGSTGYSLSAGGPIILPESNTLVITPIAPHNLNLRPIILPGDSKLKLTIGEHRGESYCTIDSKYWKINKNFEFEVKSSNFTINILRPAHTTFIDTLRNKLMWGIDNRNK